MKRIRLQSSLLALLAAGAVLAFAPLTARAADEGGMGTSGGHMKMSGDSMGHMNMAANGSELTVTGEILDMACYLDHGAHGPGHAECAQKCINSGLPVGIKAADGKTYLLIGDHMPANSELAQYAAKTITVKGKFVNRDGINLLENIQIVK